MKKNTFTMIPMVQYLDKKHQKKNLDLNLLDLILTNMAFVVVGRMQDLIIEPTKKLTKNSTTKSLKNKF